MTSLAPCISGSDVGFCLGDTGSSSADVNCQSNDGSGFLLIEENGSAAFTPLTGTITLGTAITPVPLPAGLPLLLLGLGRSG